MVVPCCCFLLLFLLLLQEVHSCASQRRNDGCECNQTINMVTALPAMGLKDVGFLKTLFAEMETAKRTDVAFTSFMHVNDMCNKRSTDDGKVVPIWQR